MKISIFGILAAMALLWGCDKPEEDYNFQNWGMNVIDVTSNGVKSRNPIDYSRCKLSGSRETLESLRHVSRGRVHFMDWQLQIPWEQFVKEGADRYAVNDFASFNDQYNNLLFNDAKKRNPIPFRKACSGFVCHNSKGELLFCRNFDGRTGPAVVLFDRLRNKGYKNMKMTNIAYCTLMDGVTDYMEDGCLTDGKNDLSPLLRLPLSVMDGINEHGLCFAAYQLPDFPEAPVAGRPSAVNQNSGKPQGTFFLLHNRILETCKTVKDVEELFDSYDYVTLMPNLNVHWFVADATGDFAVFEYWGEGTASSPYKLYVLRPEDREETMYTSLATVPYEFNSIENYYCNPEAAATYDQDMWQISYSTKLRIHNMMSHYKPVMSEREALECLQEGNFGMEIVGEITNWSCVYNTTTRTLLFNMRDDMSEVYFIDLKKELR